jgi:hypothetical protein
MHYFFTRVAMAIFMVIFGVSLAKVVAYIAIIAFIIALICLYQAFRKLVNGIRHVFA